MSKGIVSPAKFNSFGDWLRMEDGIVSRTRTEARAKSEGVLTGAGLGLQVVGENETWEYIMAKCENMSKDGAVTIDMTDCMVYAFWTCPTFWDLLRSNSLESITFYADDDDKTGVLFIANLTGMKEIYRRKVTLLSRLFVEELSVDAPNIYMEKTENGYKLHLDEAFGASGVMSIADFILIERSIKGLRSSIGDEIIHVDLRSYDISMIVDRVSGLALDDHISIEVNGTFLPTILREMAKLREKHSGMKYESYATQAIQDMVGSTGILFYDKSSRGYCLPAKLKGIVGDTVLFDVISPVNGSCTDYKKFEVNIVLPHLSVDDVLAKRSGFHVFISERFLSEEFKDSVLRKGFPND